MSLIQVRTRAKAREVTRKKATLAEMIGTLHRSPARTNISADVVRNALHVACHNAGLCLDGEA